VAIGYTSLFGDTFSCQEDYFASGTTHDSITEEASMQFLSSDLGESNGLFDSIART
jgi:hypothetical protein